MHPLLFWLRLRSGLGDAERANRFAPRSTEMRFSLAEYLANLRHDLRAPQARAMAERFLQHLPESAQGWVREREAEAEEPVRQQESVARWYQRVEEEMPRLLATGQEAPPALPPSPMTREAAEISTWYALVLRLASEEPAAGRLAPTVRPPVRQARHFSGLFLGLGTAALLAEWLGWGALLLGLLVLFGVPRLLRSSSLAHYRGALQAVERAAERAAETAAERAEEGSGEGGKEAR